MTGDPLVVTLLLDEQSQSHFDEGRRLLFPAGRTEVGAHVTLFHALPASSRPDVERALQEAARRPLLPVRVSGVYSLGRGVAYRLESDELDRVHAGWQNRWQDLLTRQDAQPLRAHVTVQNKVAPKHARSTLDQLRATFSPWTAYGVAFELWRYEGGPWTHLRSFDLDG